MDYKATLNLPTTSFPMKGNLPVREPDILDLWARENIYRRVREAAKGRPLYILHDGPPYANGNIHLGHAVNKILKDIIVKAKTMQGYDVPFLPGWDCHGLPIEHQVLKTLGAERRELSKQNIRQRCREYAEEYCRIQRDEFKRLGVWGDWDNPYLTMDPRYEAVILRELATFVARGMVYRGKKPVFWCRSCETALAEAEVEYDDHVSPSIYVKFRVISDHQHRFTKAEGRSVFCIIWTTTPWTLVANQAVCLHPDCEYVLVAVDTDEAWIIAAGCFDAVVKALKLSAYHVLDSYRGRELEGLVCRHPLFTHAGRAGDGQWNSPVILGTHVTFDQGTGCVHTAPGHGQEDYEVGRRYGLTPWAPVDDMGRFTSDIPVDVQFLTMTPVFSANETILAMLRERKTLVHSTSITHSYPHCWRCHHPVIFRATEQWFASMEQRGLRSAALESVGRVTWIPPWGEDRMRGTLEARPDWCLSRQRVWGTPIPAFRCAACGEMVMDADRIQNVAAIVEKHGAGVWFEQPSSDFLPSTFTCPNPECGQQTWDVTSDILDVWFESGVSYAAVLKPREGWWPADLYLEGSDQHRGWFQSALLAGIVADGRAPYTSVLTHGFVVDGEGKKMSKSAGNVISPQEVIKQHGAEILRLWVAAQNYREDIRISNAILSQQADAYRKIRNTFRFMLGNVNDFDPKAEGVPYEHLLDIDRWALSRLHEVIDRIVTAYGAFEFHMVFHAVTQFFSVDLSAVYFDVLKDRLYTFGRASQPRRAAQTVLYEILTSMMKLLAPILSFTVDEVWRTMPDRLRQGPMVFLASFPVVRNDFRSVELTERWNRLLQLRSIVSLKLEEKRKARVIGSSLEAKVRLFADGKTYDFLNASREELGPLFIVSQIELQPMSDRPSSVLCEEMSRSLKGDEAFQIAVEVVPADGLKCVRCWMYHIQLGKDPRHPELCDRCCAAIEEERIGVET